MNPSLILKLFRSLFLLINRKSYPHLLHSDVFLPPQYLNLLFFEMTMSFLQSRIYPYHLDFVHHGLILYCLKYKVMLSIHNINCMITSTPPPFFFLKHTLAFIKYQYLLTGRKNYRSQTFSFLFSFFCITLFRYSAILSVENHLLKWSFSKKFWRISFV